MALHVQKTKDSKAQNDERADFILKSKGGVKTLVADVVVGVNDKTVVGVGKRAGAQAAKNETTKAKWYLSRWDVKPDDVYGVAFEPSGYLSDKGMEIFKLMVLDHVNARMGPELDKKEVSRLTLRLRTRVSVALQRGNTQIFNAFCVYCHDSLPALGGCA